MLSLRECGRTRKVTKRSVEPEAERDHHVQLQVRNVHVHVCSLCVSISDHVPKSSAIMKLESKLFAPIGKRKKPKSPELRDRDLEGLETCEGVLSLTPVGLDNPCWFRNSACIDGCSIDGEVKDDSSSIISASTNATMDDNTGAGRTIDKHFYQPAGRAIERFAFKIGMRFNICHPPPVQILRFIIGSCPATC